MELLFRESIRIIEVFGLQTSLIEFESILPAQRNCASCIKRKHLKHARR